MCDVKQVSETKMPFSRYITMRLIQEYEKYPELYNVQDPLYKNKTKRQECLNKIAISLGCYGHITIGDQKERKVKQVGLQRRIFIHHIGGVLKCYISWQYSAPVRKGESNLDLESVSQQYSVVAEAAGDVSSDTPIFFDGPVDELHNLDVNLPLSPNSEELSRPCTSHSNKSDFSHTSRTAELQGKKRKITDSSSSYDLLQKATIALEKTAAEPDPVEDHVDVFGKLITTELRRIKSPKKVNELKRNIMNMLLDALDEDCPM
ncbi:hypothetical protein ABEB36_012642 [Hypothenemus hampei]|uniref:MADF domain-containing protein n=1 Tax=Hypothenemus hampei TaxID=57062 RepID=A0ABD1EEP2_HYPHA